MKDIAHMLEWMDRPAFCVEQGVITAANRAALVRQIPLGEPVKPMLLTGAEEYRAFDGGFLALRLCCCGVTYDAEVSEFQGGHIFSLEPEDAAGELRILALSAQVLRDPLGDVMALVDRLPEDTDPEQVARIRKGLYQLLRIVGNMSMQSSQRQEMQDVDAVLRELCEKAEDACGSRGVELRYRGPGRPVYSNINSELLIRAVHNLLSNSMKFAADGGRILLELSTDKFRYRISVRDWGTMPAPSQDPFTRYLREPGIEDGRAGLGLGLKLVQLAASAHGGTVLMPRLKDGFQVVMSLPINQDSLVRQNRLGINYHGDRDPMILELSDVLPPEFYK